MRLRPYGAKNGIEVVGRAYVDITTKCGKNIRDFIYVVRGHKAEPLLGNKAAKQMGILHIRPEGSFDEEVNRLESSDSKGDNDVGY